MSASGNSRLKALIVKGRFEVTIKTGGPKKHVTVVAVPVEPFAPLELVPGTICEYTTKGQTQLRSKINQVCFACICANEPHGLLIFNNKEPETITTRVIEKAIMGGWLQNATCHAVETKCKAAKKVTLTLAWHTWHSYRDLELERRGEVDDLKARLAAAEEQARVAKTLAAVVAAMATLAVLWFTRARR